MKKYLLVFALLFVASPVFADYETDFNGGDYSLDDVATPFIVPTGLPCYNASPNAATEMRIFRDGVALNQYICGSTALTSDGVWIDGAHNYDGSSGLAYYILQYFVDPPNITNGVYDLIVVDTEVLGVCAYDGMEDWTALGGEFELCRDSFIVDRPIIVGAGMPVLSSMALVVGTVGDLGSSVLAILGTILVLMVGYLVFKFGWRKVQVILENRARWNEGEWTVGASDGHSVSMWNEKSEKIHDIYSDDDDWLRGRNVKWD